ncbi:MAG: Succinylarginine dihydrolase [Hyphomicrobiales bacterium]|nr:Succinylarginine dihydrolase [Hyphomicrobiales bacterium]
MHAVYPRLDPERYVAHALHDSARDWPETNCYVDLWIEILNAAGHVPEAALGFTVEQDFEGDHFTFFKFPPEDLAALYGLHVRELALYDKLEHHLTQQAARGHLTLVEVDAFHLPDTRCVSYGLEHSKTTIAINAIDPAARRLHYFHNAGFFALEGGDYSAIMSSDANGLLPYTEFVKARGGALEADALARRACALLEEHLRFAPRTNPVRRFAAVIEAQAALVSAREPAFFHKYAFNTLRQLGANFELLGTHLDWLSAQGEVGFEEALQGCRTISSSAKSFQFQLARATARNRIAGLAQMLDSLADAYDAVLAGLRARVVS